jgi:hypothetical protein
VKSSRYAGMTSGKRLLAAGLLEAFRAAMKRRDRAVMIEMLTTVDVENAASEAEAILRHPRSL